MIKIKENTQPKLKIGKYTDGWLDRALNRTDALGRKGIDLLEENDIKIVYGDEKADIGFSKHGNKVKGVPRKQCILYKGEPPIYNIWYGWKLCSPRFLKKFLVVMSVYELDGLDQIHFNSPLDIFEYTEKLFDKPKNNFLCMVLRNKKFTTKMNRIMPKLNKYNKQSNMPLRADFDKAFCDIIGPERYHSWGRGWDKRCFHGGVLPVSVANRLGKISEYTFNFAPENSRFRGYVTEKPLQGMITGTIPIYNGAPDVERYLPKGTFIDFRGMTAKELCTLITYMPANEINDYRKRMKKFVTSKEADMYSSHIFAEKIISIIEGKL